MTDITLEQRARLMFAGHLRANGYACGAEAIELGRHSPYDRAALGAIAEALEAALRLSAGADWVLVPREPTEAMREAFKNIPLTLDDMLFQTRAWAGLEPGVRNVDDVATAADRRDFGKRYVAMLAAAPKPEDS